MDSLKTKEYILNHFHYHKDGTLTRDDREGGLGSYDKDGYLIIKVRASQYKAHRVVWLLNYGDWPKQELDHINRNRTDNRIENLREADRTIQNLNRPPKYNDETKCCGVHINHTKGLKKKYEFHSKGKTYRFYTLEDALKKRTELCLPSC